MTLSWEASLLDQNHLIKTLLSGSAALFPTDTVPAIAACPKYAKQLWTIKKRPLEKPLILMGSDSDELFKNILPLALKDAKEIAERYWPGALTMVLPYSGKLVHTLNPGSSSLGIRVPGCQIARNLISRTGPLATTSANIAGLPPALSAQQAANSFPGVPLLGPEPWPSPSGLASTVIKWEDPGEWKVLRVGAVMPEGIDKK